MYHSQEPLGGGSQERRKKEEGVYTCSWCIYAEPKGCEAVCPNFASFHSENLPHATLLPLLLPLLPRAFLLFSIWQYQMAFVFHLSWKTPLQRRGSTVTSVGGELSTISLGAPRSVPYCVIPRPQFLPLSNGDLITNLPGLLWRVTEDNPPMLSYS